MATEDWHQQVELIPAWSWDCPACGVENFVRGLVPEMLPEELQELRDEHGVQPWETGDFVEMPDEVVCRSCGLGFATVHFGEDDDA